MEIAEYGVDQLSGVYLCRAADEHHMLGSTLHGRKPSLPLTHLLRRGCLGCSGVLITAFRVAGRVFLRAIELVPILRGEQYITDAAAFYC